MKVPRTSRAAVLTGAGGRVNIEELPVPALEPGGLLVHVSAATVCGTDAHIRSGQLSMAKFPLVMGHEGVGEIVALDGRTHDVLDQLLSVGDRIAFSYPWCGHCYWCAVARQPTLCNGADMYGWGSGTASPELTGTFSEYVYVKPACQVVKVPASVDDAVASSATCALRSVMHGFERLEKLGPIGVTDTVLVLGSGAVGLYAAAVAAARGVSQVVVIGAPQHRLAIAERWGVTRTMDLETTTSEHRKCLVEELTEGRSADIVIDCAGPAAAFKDALGLVRPGGRVLEIGASDPTPVSVNPLTFNVNMVSVVGSRSGSIEHFVQAFRFVDKWQHEIDFSLLLSPPRPLEAEPLMDALGAVGAASEIKPVIRNL